MKYSAALSSSVQALTVDMNNIKQQLADVGTQPCAAQTNTVAMPQLNSLRCGNAKTNSQKLRLALCDATPWLK